jgi:hypothetical protein
VRHQVGRLAGDVGSQDLRDSSVSALGWQVRLDDLVDVRAAISATQQAAVIIPVAADRWAVVPSQEDGSYVETENLAELLSLAAGSVTASFDVFDSDVMVAILFRDGRARARPRVPSLAPFS